LIPRQSMDLDQDPRPHPQHYAIFGPQSVRVRAYDITEIRAVQFISDTRSTRYSLSDKMTVSYGPVISSYGSIQINRSFLMYLGSYQQNSRQ